MTRSTLSRGPEVTNKQFRANSNATGMTFRRESAGALNLFPKRKPSIARGMGPRTNGKMHQTYRNGRALVHIDDSDDIEDYTTVSPDGTDYELCTLEFEPSWVVGDDGLGQEPQGPVLASLLDIAKPAKPKGVAKDFEVVESVTRVIALEDDVWQVYDGDRPLDNDDFWEEWDEAYRECGTIDNRKPLYSEVVEGKVQVDRPIKHTCNDLCSGW